MIVRALAGIAVVPFLLGAAASPQDRERVAFRFADPAITEASALVPLPGGLFATTNDSGDVGRVFTVDSGGRTVGVTTWGDATDVEALAPAPGGEVWVGDIGDNTGSRGSVHVARVPVGRGDRTVSPTVYDLVYPDGGHDAETLLCDPATGRLYVATKSFAGGVLYAAPQHLTPGRPNRLRAVAPVLPIATDGAFFPDGRHVVVRGYVSAVVYSWPSMRRVASLRLPPQPQGEGIGVAADGRIYLSSEGPRAQVLRVPLPRRLRAEVEPAPGPTASPSPSPSASPSAQSRTALHETEQAHREWWPWLLGAIVGLAVVGVLLRSLRPR